MYPVLLEDPELFLLDMIASGDWGLKVVGRDKEGLLGWHGLYTQEQAHLTF